MKSKKIFLLQVLAILFFFSFNSSLASVISSVPQWIKNPEVKGLLVAVGHQKIGKEGLQFARLTALAKAKDSLYRKIRNYILSNCDCIDRNVLNNIITKISPSLLKASKINDVWISPNNTIYMLIELEEKEVKQAVKEELKNFLIKSY